MTPAHSRLPNRRPAYTETLEVDGQVFEATVGFDPEGGSPRELFLTAGKEGSMLNALLADAAVVISVAFQHGVPLSRPSHWRPYFMEKNEDLEMRKLIKTKKTRQRKRNTSSMSTKT